MSSSEFAGIGPAKLVPKLALAQGTAGAAFKLGPSEGFVLSRIDGITSLSAVPLRLISALGIVIFVGSLGMTIWVFWTRLFTDSAVPGWASTVIPMYFLGGIQLLSLGVLGEYVAKSYLETKMRPRFFVETLAAILAEAPLQIG